MLGLKRESEMALAVREHTVMGQEGHMDTWCRLMRAARVWRKPLSQPVVGGGSGGILTLLTVTDRKPSSEPAQKSKRPYQPM